MHPRGRLTWRRSRISRIARLCRMMRGVWQRLDAYKWRALRARYFICIEARPRALRASISLRRSRTPRIAQLRRAKRWVRLRLNIEMAGP